MCRLLYLQPIRAQSEYIIYHNFVDNQMESFSGDIAPTLAALNLGDLMQITLLKSQMKVGKCLWNSPSIIYYVHDIIKQKGICFCPSSLLGCCFTVSSQVGESSLQSGNLYSPFMKMCRNLFLGSNQSDQGHSFRGNIGGLVLWGYERSHEDLLKQPLQTDKSKPLLAMWADFTKVTTIFNFYIFSCSVFAGICCFIFRKL